MKIVGCDLHARQQTIAMVDPRAGQRGNNCRGRTIGDRLELRKSDSTRTLSHFRSAAAWDEFIADLFEEWDGHWTKSPH